MKVLEKKFGVELSEEDLIQIVEDKLGVRASEITVNSNGYEEHRALFLEVKIIK